MAHRQLMDKYAKDLIAAKQRIIQLETAVADCEDRLEHTNAAHHSDPSEGVDKNITLHAQFERANRRTKELESAVSEKKHAELAATREQADKIHTETVAEVKKLQEELEALTKSDLKTRGDVGRLLI